MPKKMEGLLLKKLRKIMNRSQTEFGEMMGYHHPQIRISEVERGVKQMGHEKSDQVRRLVFAIAQSMTAHQQRTTLRELLRLADLPCPVLGTYEKAT